MDSSRTPLICAVGALVAWSLKGVAIGAAGGLDRSPWEGPLFLVGLAFALAGAVSTGLVLTAGRGPAVRAGAALVGVVVVPAVALAVDAVVRAVTTSDHWSMSEVNLWVSCLLLLAVAGGVATAEPSDTGSG